MSEQHYLKVGKIEVPVTEEVYSDYMRSFWREENRSKYRSKVEYSYERQLEDDFQFDSGEKSVEDTVADNFLRDTLHEALRSLDDGERALIIALLINDKTEREMAVALGISNVAVHKRKTRIIEKMKKFFD